jgi:GT2 family glycosyltransferase
VPSPPATVDLLAVVWNETQAELERYTAAVGDAWAALPPDRRGRAVVVKNGPHPAGGVVVRLLRERLGLEPVVVELARNVGFARGTNEGLARTTADYVALLDPDGAPAEDMLARLAEALDAAPDALLAAAEVVDFASAPRDGGAVLELEWGPGGATLYRRAAFTALRGFDELFPWYCQDMDLGVRARRAGWHCLRVPGVLFHHPVGRSASVVRVFRFTESLLAWRHVHYPRRVVVKSWLAQLPLLVRTNPGSRTRAAVGGALGLIGYLRLIPRCERRRA